MSTPGLVYDGTLAQNEIRLMRIEKSPQPDDLRFSLDRYIREKAPAYVALSYTCGHEPEIHEILIDDKVVKIRPNLWQALYYITTEKEALDKEWRYLWCDAICINQPNIAEKSEQIRGMYTTYRQATVVFAWLGIDRSGKYDERAANSKGIWKTFKNQNKTDLFKEGERNGCSCQSVLHANFSSIQKFSLQNTSHECGSFKKSLLHEILSQCLAEPGQCPMSHLSAALEWQAGFDCANKSVHLFMQRSRTRQDVY